ncbi:hypothetical protein, partial [Endozoicomonas sp. ONNA2]|uniref:hypothetical protein n=1 Tax=Endozoicomonas sp. ONNA2 TaxID=2828741 RepID=UPI002148FD0A
GACSPWKSRVNMVSTNSYAHLSPDNVLAEKNIGQVLLKQKFYFTLLKTLPEKPEPPCGKRVATFSQTELNDEVIVGQILSAYSPSLSAAIVYDFNIVGLWRT